METEAATHRCLEPFRWASLRGWDFRPQLIVVSNLFGGNPFMDGIFRPQLIVVSGLLGGNPFMDGIFRPQLVVVSGLFGGNPFMDGIFRQWDF
jgi:hypothetical protein